MENHCERKTIVKTDEKPSEKTVSESIRKFTEKWNIENPTKAMNLENISFKIFPKNEGISVTIDD